MSKVYNVQRAGSGSKVVFNLEPYIENEEQLLKRETKEYIDNGRFYRTADTVYGVCLDEDNELGKKGEYKSSILVDKQTYSITSSYVFDVKQEPHNDLIRISYKRYKLTFVGEQRTFKYKEKKFEKLPFYRHKEVITYVNHQLANTEVITESYLTSEVIIGKYDHTTIING